MRRVGADRVGDGRGQACKSRAFGAMAVQYVGRERFDPLRYGPQRTEIAGIELTCNWYAQNAKSKPRREIGKNSIGVCAARRRVDDKADTVAALDLTPRDVNDVAEETAERRAQHMEDLQARRSIGRARRRGRARLCRHGD